MQAKSTFSVSKDSSLDCTEVSVSPWLHLMNIPCLCPCKSWIFWHYLTVGLLGVLDDLGNTQFSNSNGVIAIFQQSIYWKKIPLFNVAKHDKPTIYEHQVLLFIARKTEEKVVNWPQSLLRDLRHLVNNISIINSLQSFGQRAEDSTSLRHLPQLALQKYLCTDEGKGQACFTKTADQELQPISNFGSPGGNCAKLGREHNCFWTWQCKGQTIAGFCPWFQRGGQSSRDRKTIWPWTLALYWLHNQSHRWDHKREESVSACCKALLESTANIGAFC